MKQDASLACSISKDFNFHIQTLDTQHDAWLEFKFDFL